MKKVYKIEVDCANCANIIQEEANKIQGIKSADVNFIMQKMTVIFDDGYSENEVIKRLYKACKKIEPDFYIEL